MRIINNEVTNTADPKVKYLTLKNNKVVSVVPGDVLLATISPDGDDDVLFKCRFVSIENGLVNVYILDPQYNLVDLTIKENRVVSVERPN